MSEITHAPEVVTPAAPTADAPHHTMNRRTFMKGAAGVVAGATLAAVISEGHDASATPGRSQTTTKTEGGKCLVYVQEPFMARLQRALKERSVRPLAEKFLIERDC